MSVRRRVEKQKAISANRLEKMTGGLAPITKFTEMNIKVKRAQLKNFSAGLARHIAEDGRVGMMITLTFGQDTRIDLTRMGDTKLLESAKTQHKSLMSFLNKMRRSKRIKSDIRYMATTELQSDGNLHLHIFLSVEEDDLFGLIEFIYDFKKRYPKPYTYQHMEVYPIGRLHIGISIRYQRQFQQRYMITPVPAKSDSSRTENYISCLESREFWSGNWTPVEFYTEKMINDRYEEHVTNYLLKTLDGEYELEEKDIKEGVAKCQLGHDTKTVFSNAYISKLQVRFVRSVGRQLYTHSVLPFSHKLYQRHYRRLKEYNPNYTLYYRCITDLQEGKLIVKGQNIFDDTGYQIAPLVHQSQKKESL
ncbi:MAG: hypothetical protein U9R26_07195 [Campylobacterota bacterium]|nr:hypothetical protein [Campylobacterota bacterium]